MTHAQSALEMEGASPVVGCAMGARGYAVLGMTGPATSTTSFAGARPTDPDAGDALPL
jgi:hypothetical protein